MSAVSSPGLGPLDPASERAVFQQIADRIREAIERGTFREDDRLPSESQLTQYFKVARMTARQAVHVLRDEGLVISKRGQGVFVRPRPDTLLVSPDRLTRSNREQGMSAFLLEADATGRSPGVDGLELKVEAPNPEIAGRLGYPDEVLARRCRYLLDGRPVEYGTSYLPLDIARGTAIAQPDPGPGGIYARLEELGHHLDCFEEEIRARMPSPEESRALRLTAGVPVVHLLRTAFDACGRPVEVFDTILAADTHVLFYSLPAS